MITKGLKRGSRRFNDNCREDHEAVEKITRQLESPRTFQLVNVQGFWLKNMKLMHGRVHLFEFEWEWDGGGVGVGTYSRPGAYQRFLPLGWALI